MLILAATGALLAFQAEGQAQTIKEWGLKVWNKMMEPDKKMDSTYVFQPFKGWNLSTTYKARWDKIGIEAPVEFSVLDANKSEFYLNLNLVEDVTHHVGLGVGYGPISLGYSVAIRRGNKRDRHFSFDWTGTRFAVQFNYSKIHDLGKCTVSMAGWAEPDEIQGIETTASLWRVSGFYIFNHRKFSYPSAYTGKLVQKKSAGSFLVGAKYLHSNIRLPEQSTVVSSLVLDLIGYSTHQVSIGAGYSFNWVLYHRDAQTSKDIRRLRNLTFNVTAIPLLTFVNEMRMTHLTETGKEMVPVHGNLQPNALGQVGLCYAIGHFYVNCGFEYNYNIFRTKQLTKNDLSPNPGQESPFRYKLTLKGHLANCVGSLELHYRF